MIIVSNIPNVLTTSRIIIIPAIILTFYFDDIIFAHQLAAILFVFASITDFFDGYIAKKFNFQTKIGMMMDPIADKLLIGSTLIMIIKFRKAPELPCILILSREFIVSGMREFLSNIRVNLPVSRLAKVKTTVQMIALAILLIGSKGSGVTYLDTVGQIALWIASILTVITGYSYLRMCIRYI